MEQSSIDYLILANHAEAVNGMLNVLGGGWTDLNRLIPAGGGIPISHFGVAISVCIPWNETNKQHRLAVRIVNDDASATLVELDTRFSVGRPPNLPNGAVQHTVIAMNADVMFASDGGYEVRADLDNGVQERTWAFRVHDVQLPTSPMPFLR